MEAIYDISVYCIFAVIMSIFAFHAYQKEELSKEKYIHIHGNDIYWKSCWNIYMSYYVLFFTFIAAVRWNVGSDSLNYAYSFKMHIIQDDSPEYLFVALMEFIKKYRLHFAIGMGIMAFIQIFFITKSLTNFKPLLIYIPFVLFGGRYWLDLVGACRQMIVACIFMWSMKYIVERKMLKYLITIVICYFIHNSSLLLLPIYFLYSKSIFLDKRLLTILLIIVCCILGQTSFLSHYINELSELTTFIGYDKYSSFVSEKLVGEGDVTESLAFGPIMISFLVLSLFTVWFAPRLEELYSQTIPEFYLWYNVSLLYSCGYFLVCNTSHLFIRPFNYLVLCQMYMVALTLKYLIDGYSETIRNQFSCVVLCFTIALCTVWSLFKETDRITSNIVYKTIFVYDVKSPIPKDNI